MLSSSRIVPMAAPVLRFSAASRLRPCVAKPIMAVHGLRYYASNGRAKLVREMDRSSRLTNSRMNQEKGITHVDKAAHAEYFKDGGGPLFPGTFISLPLSLAPRSPAAFAQYQWSRLKQWGTENLSVLNFKLKSMPNWTTRPKWKARQGKIAPTAKAMYQEMLEAFASGDKATLKRICVGEFGMKLIAAIERRNPREQVRFQLVKYNNPLFYPKLLAHQVHNMNPFNKASVTEQAVVAISSTQQVSKHHISTGETIPGSVKIQDKIEYVVITRQGNQNTFEFLPWRVWGTTAATTLESYLEEKAAIEYEQAKRSGWKATSK
ncbi:hypothetical protein PT974_01311 [Cladobotryum mycophilum]|uniref:Tim44-like domain-containing protein n=1 Tax=Cladobotryum mycophilum TaxID=491253 RepID=A0ABR0T484_9HYPO